MEDENKGRGRNGITIDNTVLPKATTQERNKRFCPVSKEIITSPPFFIKGHVKEIDMAIQLR